MDAFTDSLRLLSCPHSTIEQIWEAAQLIKGRRIHENTALWIFTPSAIKAMADRNGYSKIIEAAGPVQAASIHWSVIRTGDWVKVDADRCLVTVTRPK